MALVNDMKQLKRNFEEGLRLQTKIEANSNMDVLGLDAGGEQELLEKMISGYVEQTASHLIKLKSRLNTFAAINKLPIELLTRIILLTNTFKGTNDEHPYISYTWVCHHWRSVLIHNPQFWTSIRLKRKNRHISPFVDELIRRSKSAKLDVKLSYNSENFIPYLQDFFTKESTRIRTLWFECRRDHLIQSVFAGRRFPSLRRVVQVGNCGPDLIFLADSLDQLETLECNLRWRESDNDSTPRLGRLRKLSITVFASEDVVQSVLDSLHNSTKLQSLQLQLVTRGGFTNQTILPELQFLSTNDPLLLEHIQAPKLSSLEVQSNRAVNFENPIFDNFDFSSIKYLHALDRNRKKGFRQVCEYVSILGLQSPIHPTSEFSIITDDVLEEYNFARDVDDMVNVKDILSDNWPPANYFRLKLDLKEGEDMDLIVEAAITSILPRLTTLSEFSSLMSRPPLYKNEMCFDEILLHAPLLEKLIVSDHKGIIDFLNSTLSCPRLKHISYTIVSAKIGPELAKLGKNVGKLLIRHLQSRQKVHGDVLKSMFLGSCPPIPERFLKEMQALGVTVVAEKDIEIIITRMLPYHFTSDTEDSED